MLGVLWQTVATIAKAEIVVIAADARFKAHAFDDLLRIQSFHLGIGVQLIEVGHVKSQISIGKELNRFRLRKAHDQRVNVLCDGALLQQTRKGIRGLHQTSVIHIRANDDPAGIEVVLQDFGFPQELRTEKDVVAVVFLPYRGSEA